jgi:hypothetical protein
MNNIYIYIKNTAANGYSLLTFFFCALFCFFLSFLPSFFLLFILSFHVVPTGNSIFAVKNLK